MSCINLETFLQTLLKVCSINDASLDLVASVHHVFQGGLLLVTLSVLGVCGEELSTHQNAESGYFQKSLDVILSININNSISFSIFD